MGLKRAKHTRTGPFCKRSSCFHANAFARAPGTERSLPQLLRAAGRFIAAAVALARALKDKCAGTKTLASRKSGAGAGLWAHL